LIKYIKSVLWRVSKRLSQRLKVDDGIDLKILPTGIVSTKFGLTVTACCGSACSFDLGFL
jgi:hypothetical protein